MNVLDQTGPLRTRLIVSPTDKRVPTNSRETDATTALSRGVAEYVANQSIVAAGGRALRFATSFDTWAEPAESACYPAFIAYTHDADGEYGAANMSPKVSTFRYPDGSYEVSGSSLEIALKCEIWATDPEERMALALMLEEAFAPVEWMEGFRLELPHYFNQRATFLPGKITYLGDAVDVMSGYWKARIIVAASVPRTRVLPFAEGQPRVLVKEVGPNVDVTKKA